MKTNIFRYILTGFVLMCVCNNSLAQFKNYDKIFDFDKFGFARVCNNYETDNQLMGLVDANGREIIPLKYYDVDVSDSKVAVVTEASEEGDEGLKALVDLKTGKEITKFKFFWINSFENGLAFAETEEGNEIIDTQGNSTKKTNIEYAEYKGDGFVLKLMDDGVMFVNMDGKPISNQIFKDAYHFDDMWIEPKNGWMQVWMPDVVDDFNNRFSHWLSNKGELLSNDEYLLKVKNESFYISYDREMNEMVVYSQEGNKSIFTFKADVCVPVFSENLIIAKQNNRYRLLNLKGNVLIEAPLFYGETDRGHRGFNEGLMLIRDDNNKECFINVDGKKVLDYTEKYVCYFNSSVNSPYFSEGLAPYKSNNLVGFIDKAGSEVITAAFKSVGPFVNGYAIVQGVSNEKYGIIDKTGKLVLPCNYKACECSKLGLALVTLDNDKQTFVRIKK